MVIAILIGILYLLPKFWQRLERFNPSTNELAARSTGNELAARSTGNELAARSTGNELAARSTGNELAARSTGNELAVRSTGNELAVRSTGNELAARSTDYRLPYGLSSDYWIFRRWSEYACSKYPVLVIGDSVIWGQYVTMEQTLSHYLNGRAGENIFANVGVDGTHPAAILGLVRYYGRAISNKGIILHLNPLWMSSKEHDLSGEEEFRFNHPRLVPQFIRKPACYRPALSQRIGVILERRIPFFSWTSHIRTNYFENMDLQNWTMQNPYTNPLKAITLEIPTPENRPKSKPVTWTERGMKKQDFPWVQVEDSFQWDSFKKVIEILKARKNRVFVILGPFNPYILTAESLRRYNSMKSEMERWLEGQGISYRSLTDLPSEYYADASHPLKEGYAKIAEELFEMESFREWIRD